MAVTSVIENGSSVRPSSRRRSGLLKRREAAAERETGRIVALKRNALDVENKLTRLYEAIEAGLADSNIKRRIAELKQIRDAVQADIERAEGRGGPNRDHPRGAPDLRPGCKGADARRRRSFRRNHVQQLVQRAEVGTDEIRTSGCKSLEWKLRRMAFAVSI